MQSQRAISNGPQRELVCPGPAITHWVLICFATAWRQKIFQRLKTEMKIQVPKMKGSVLLCSLMSYLEGSAPAPQLSGTCWKGSFWNISS